MPSQIWVLVFVADNQLSCGRDDFGLDHLVAGQTMPPLAEANPSTEHQSGNAHSHAVAMRDGAIDRVKAGIDIGVARAAPTCARAPQHRGWRPRSSARHRPGARWWSSTPHRNVRLSGSRVTRRSRQPTGGSCARRQRTRSGRCLEVPSKRNRGSRAWRSWRSLGGPF